MTFFYDTQSLFQRGLVKMVRNPTIMVTYLIEPVAFLVLFSQMFSKLGDFLPPHSGGYVAYLTPGIFIFCALIASPQSGLSLVNDINSGFLSKILLTQSSRWAIILGRMLTDVTLTLGMAVITLVVAFVMGVSVSYGVPGVFLIFVTISFFEMAFSGIFMAVGIASKRVDTLSAVSGFLYLPLIFLSTAMFPSGFLPGWAQTFSNYNPVTFVANTTRELVSGGLSYTTLVDGYILTGAIALVTLGMTVYQFEKVVS